MAALTTQMVSLLLTDEKFKVQACFCSLSMNKESLEIGGWYVRVRNLSLLEVSNFLVG